MNLRELGARRPGRSSPGTATRPSPPSRTTRARRGRARSSSPSRARHRRQPVRGGGAQEGRVRHRLRAAGPAGRRGCRSRTRAGAGPSLPSRLFGTDSYRRGHRHQRQDDDDLPHRRRPARGRPQGRPDRHRAIPHRRPPGRRHALHARGFRPPGPLARDGGRGLLARRARGLVALARAPARGRLRVPGGRVHEPHPRPSRLPRRHGFVLPGQAQAVRGAGAPGRTVRDQRGRRPGGRADRRLARPVWTYGIDKPADFRAEDIRLALDGTRFRLRSPLGTHEVASALVAASTSRTCWPPSRRRGGRGSRTSPCAAWPP